MKRPTFNTKTVLLSTAIALSITGCGSESDDNSNNNITDKKPDAAIGWSSTIVKDNIDATTSSKIAVYDLSSGSNSAVTSMDDVQGDWHFSYQKSRGFQSNSGSNGIGNSGIEVEGCIAHQYTDLYDENGDPKFDLFANMTASSTLEKFESLDINACNDFQTDIAATSKYIGNEWYALEGYSIAIPEGTTGWIIKSNTDTYARITPKEYDGGLVFSVETWNGNSWDTAVDTPAIDYYSGSNAYYDFDTNTANATPVQGWDIYLKNTEHLPEIILAEDAGVGYYYDSSDEDAFTYESVAQLDHPTAPTVGATLYKWYENTTNGVFTNPGYFGGLEFKDYGYVPNYATYLLKEGNTYYKVQFLGYNGIDGEHANGTLVVRYSSKTVEE